MINVNLDNAIVLRPNICIVANANEQSPHFESKVKAMLDSLEQNSVGKRLIEKIGNAAHTIYITQGKDFYCYGENKDAGTLGKGCLSLITCPDSSENVIYHTASLTLASKPPLVDFAHELIHAYHNSRGNNAGNLFRCDTLVWSDDEEYHVIMGFPSKKPGRKTPKITENAILAALGLPERFSHLNPSSIQPVIHQRMKLVADLYNRFCKETQYDGQSKNPPPPIINCTCRDLAPSNRVMRFYKLMTPKFERETLIVNAIDTLLPSEDFVKEVYDGERCPIAWKLQKMFPSHADKKVVSVGLYRISALEADALDTSTGLKEGSRDSNI